MIKQVMNALCAMDYKTFAECFSEDCRYFDYCPSMHGSDNYFVYGRDCIEMFFRNRFTFELFLAFEPKIEDERTASFFGLYDGLYVFARLKIEELDSLGFVKKAVVYPA